MFEQETIEARKLLFGKRIGVVMGGYSSEREISLISGEAIAKALEEGGYAVERIVVDRKEIHPEKIQGCDVIFIALHGKGGEDGAFQGLLEWFDKPYAGSGVLGSAISLNKYITKRMIEEFGIPTPAYSLNKQGEIKPPLVVKAVSEGSTIGLEICPTQEAFESAMNGLRKYGDLIVEKFIEGRLLTVGVVLGKALEIIEIRPKDGFYDFQHKYQAGMTEYICPAELPETLAEKIKGYSETAHRVCHCEGMSRSDFILGEDGTPWFLEINTIPGFTSTSLLPKAAKSCGLSFLDLILVILKSALEKGK